MDEGHGCGEPAGKPRPSTTVAIANDRAFSARAGFVSIIDLKTAATHELPAAIEHPMAVRAAPDGTIWIADYGIVAENEDGLWPRRRTGRLWRIISY